MRLVPLPALSDNYIWMLDDARSALVVDPGETAPVAAALEARALTLAAILITHHHPDHTGAVLDLAERYAPRIVAPRAERARIAGATEWVDDGEIVEALGVRFHVISVPGHTLGHVAYHAPSLLGTGVLFCGDTLFSAGCGRLFEGTPEQMYASLQKLAALPPATAVCCTHEYTLANLAFARAAEPGNADVARHIEQVESLRARGLPSLPSSLALERRINPYLRCDVPEVRAAAAAHGARGTDPVAVFAALRAWKDGFRAPAL